MKRFMFLIMTLMTPFAAAQVPNDADGNFDSTTYVETNGTTASTSDVTSTNTNTNTNNNTSVSTSTNTNTNNNTNISASTSSNTNVNTNNNILSGGTTNTNTNNNNNVSTSTNTNTNNNYSESISVTNNTNNNNNVNDTIITATNNNTNVNTSTSTSNNTNNSTVQSNSTAVNTNNTTSNNTNTNVSSSESVSESTATNTNTNNNVNENRSVSESNQTQNINQKIESPPPSAIAPSIGSSYSQDLCTTGISGAVQTQIFGISGGKSVTDSNCERIKLSKTLYDMGMRVAAVSLMCQDERVFMAMRMAGTPCPFEGKIGDEAGAEWNDNPNRIPEGDLTKQVLSNSRNGKLDDGLEVMPKEQFCEAYPNESICAAG